MPRRPTRGRGGGRAASHPRKRHLYLVTEDWKEGYSIRQIDLAEDHRAAASDADEQEPRRLPPPVLRLEAPHNGPQHFAAAFGTKIMALHLTPWRYAPVFDVNTRSLTFGPRYKGITTSPLYVPIGDRLFKLGFRRFQSLCPPPPRVELLWCDVPIKWSWRCLPIPPFGERAHLVTSHAVHPDGRTLFVSVKVKGQDTGDTFTYDTGADDPDWTPHPDWELPFKGLGHYDCRLDAWVGLTDDPAMAGHICSCRVPSLDDACWQPPVWKLSREKLFCGDPAETHTGASLVCLGTGYKSRFCLVECLSRNGGGRHQLRLTTFSPRYHKNGDLGTNSHRLVQSFKFPKTRGKDTGFLKNPVAFWL